MRTAVSRRAQLQNEDSEVLGRTQKPWRGGQRGQCCPQATTLLPWASVSSEVRIWGLSGDGSHVAGPQPAALAPASYHGRDEFDPALLGPGDCPAILDDGLF